MILKMNTLSCFHRLASTVTLKCVMCLLAFLVTATGLVANDRTPTVLYTPSLKLIEGDQPLLTSYVLSITSPPNVALGSSLSISPVISVNSSPVGVTTSTALSFISLSPATLVFTGPNQTLTTTVTANVPEGTIAGNYDWAISTPGWPLGTLDPSGFINAKVTIPLVPFPPTVTISAPLDASVYTYVFGGPPVSIPLAFAATAPPTSPITSIDADVNGTAVSLVSSGLGTGAVLANGTIQLAQDGVFTVRARATNNVGTSANTVEISVIVQAPPPDVVIVAPVITSYILAPGAALNIPFTFTGTSLHGGISSLSATLGGNPVSVTPSGLGSLSATGSGSLAINAAGSYVLAVTATSQHGTTSVTRTITVTDQALQPPTVSIAQPLNGAVFTHVAGSPPLSLPFAFTATAAPGSNISSVNGALNGSSVSVTASGLGSPVAGGTGNLSVSTPGSYTFVAGTISGGLNGSNSISFTVVETAPPVPDCSVEWLPPISLGKVEKGGSVLPIKFVLECHCKDKTKPGNADLDPSVTIAIYEIFPNGSTSVPRLFPYSPKGKDSDKDGTYAITGGQYHLNYDLARGAHLYHIDVYRQPNGSTLPQLLGTKEFSAR